MSDCKAKILALRRSKSEEERRACIGLLSDYLTQNPQDAEAWYDKAGCHDFLGEEKEAEPCYRKTYELGWQNLPAGEQKSFFVGFGSTLRNNLKYGESISVLKEGIKRFPDYAPLKVFLAFSFYSDGQDRLAAETMIPACIEAATSGLGGFDKAIKYYSENLKNYPEARGHTIKIVPYRPEWPQKFIEVKNRLGGCLEGHYLSIDHIGSTSVPGLGSKDRIDVQVTVDKIDDTFKAAIDKALVSGGFQSSRWNEDHQPPGDTSSSDNWKKLYISGVHAELNFLSNIHVRANGKENQAYPLLFRDYLRKHANAAQAYQRLKEELAKHHAHEPIKYTEIKDPACDLIMVDARRWAKEIGWCPN